MLETMPIEQRIISRTINFIFKIKNNMIPAYLSNTITLNRDINPYIYRKDNEFRLPNFERSAFQNSIFHKRFGLFDSLPEKLNKEKCIDKFMEKANVYIKYNF